MALPTAGTGAEQDQFWPLPKFYFSVDIGEFTDLPFQEVSGLDIDTEVIEYRHGNSPNHSAIKMPGLMKYSDITLKKGVFADENNLRRPNLKLGEGIIAAGGQWTAGDLRLFSSPMYRKFANAAREKMFQHRWADQLLFAAAVMMLGKEQM